MIFHQVLGRLQNSLTFELLSLAESIDYLAPRPSYLWNGHARFAASALILCAAMQPTAKPFFDPDQSHSDRTPSLARFPFKHLPLAVHISGHTIICRARSRNDLWFCGGCERSFEFFQTLQNLRHCFARTRGHNGSKVSSALTHTSLSCPTWPSLARSVVNGRRKPFGRGSDVRIASRQFFG